MSAWIPPDLTGAMHIPADPTPWLDDAPTAPPGSDTGSGPSTIQPTALSDVASPHEDRRTRAAAESAATTASLALGRIEELEALVRAMKPPPKPRASGPDRDGFAFKMEKAREYRALRERGVKSTIAARRVKDELGRPIKRTTLNGWLKQLEALETR